MSKRRRFAAIAAALLFISAGLLAAAAITLYVPEPTDDAPRVLISVDRSIWNIAGLNRLTYVRALREAGLRTVLVDYASLEKEAMSPADLFIDIHALVLTGGGDVAASRYGSDSALSRGVNEKRDVFELLLLAEADRLAMPVLGLCRGAQLLNVYHGGTLLDFRDDPVQFRKHARSVTGHSVTVEPDSRLAAIFGTSALPAVVTYHGQAIGRTADYVKVVARSEEGLPEAIEVRSSSRFGQIGVQWHAEFPLLNADQAKLFAALGSAAAEWREQ